MAKELDVPLKPRKSEDEWVKEKPKYKGKMARLTFDIPAPLHRKLRIKAVTEGVTMADMLRKGIAERREDSK